MFFAEEYIFYRIMGSQWFCGRVLDSRQIVFAGLGVKEVTALCLNIFLLLKVHCVPGKTKYSGQCVLCDVGTYKEDAGNTACTNCSSIRTTVGKGSISQADCNIGESYIMKCLKS